jgi:hypothetical protein
MRAEYGRGEGILSDQKKFFFSLFSSFGFVRVVGGTGSA